MVMTTPTTRAGARDNDAISSDSGKAMASVPRATTAQITVLSDGVGIDHGGVERLLEQGGGICFDRGNIAGNADVHLMRLQPDVTNPGIHLQRDLQCRRAFHGRLNPVKCLVRLLFRDLGY